MNKKTLKFKEIAYKYWWSILLIIAFIWAIIAMAPAVFVGHLSFNSIRNNTPLTRQLVTGQNTTRKTITMVYRNDCQYCENARKTIGRELASHNDTAVQFSQIDYRTDKGKSLLKQFNAKGVPLIVVTDTTTNTSHAFNDDDANGIKQLLNKYAFNKD